MSIQKSLQDLMIDAEVSGFLELGSGVYLQSSECIEENQALWSDYDECKKFDFSVCDFWITTDSGSDPEGFDSIEEAIISYLS